MIDEVKEIYIEKIEPQRTVELDTSYGKQESDEVVLEIIPTNITYKIDEDSSSYGFSAKVDESMESIMRRLKRTICFDIWFEENWTKEFSDFGLEAPIFECEDGAGPMDSIDQFRNDGSNGMTREVYEAHMNLLKDIAEESVDVEIIGV